MTNPQKAVREHVDDEDKQLFKVVESTTLDTSNFGEVRTLVKDDGSVLFCGNDVAQALGYEKERNAIARHCRYALKQGVPHPQSPDKTIEMTFIPESDVYRLAFGSKLESAEKFTDWVVEEVLPSIRKTGAYDEVGRFNPPHPQNPEKSLEMVCGKDVAEALGYTNPRKALAEHCRCVTKCYVPHPQLRNIVGASRNTTYRIRSFTVSHIIRRKTKQNKQ